jgi:hypothetical protein
MTKQNLRVKNPSLTLYAFHLRSEMTTEVVAEAAHLWEKLRHLGEFFSMPTLQHFVDKMICYQNGQYYPDGEQGKLSYFLELIQPKGLLSFSSGLEDNMKLGASIYPLRLHDTYAVDLTFFLKNQIVDVNQLSRFNPQGCLMPNHIQASLGQTLLLYAEPIGEEIANQDLANECVKALLQETHQPSPPLSREGRLFGCPIFEYELIPKLYAPHPNELTHILVWLGKYEEVSELVEKANLWLINLLNCRHKILFAYHQACQSNESARQIYNALEAKTEALNQLPEAQAERLKSLEQLLNETSHDTFEYARHLRNLGDQRTTIQTNMGNYVKWLGHLRDLSLKTDDLTFLNDFHDQTCRHHHQQLGIEQDYLKPGHQLFSQMTATILGMVHIGEQKQQIIRDQKFQFLITFIGAAVGAGAISATVIQNPPHLIDLVSQLFEAAQLPIIDLPQWLSLFPALSTDILKVIFHLLVGGVTSLVFTPLISFLSRLFTRNQ